MAKLGAKLKQDQEEKQQGKPTRTQRVAYAQARKRDELARQRFESLRTQAKKIQEEKFKEKVVEYDQAYTTYRPSNYTARQWDRLSTSARNYQIKKMNRGYSIARKLKKGQVVVHSTGTRKATKTIPFTLEDGENSYKSVYEGLSPDLKQFFDTPDAVLEQKAERIKTTKQTVKEKLAYADQKIQERKDYYAKKIQDRQTWWSNKPSSYRTKKRKERHKERLNDYEDDLDEDIAKWQGYKEGLSKGSQGLDQNKDLDFSSIENYAWDTANYYENREEARNDARNSFNQSKRSGELDETFKQLGLKENTGYSTYTKAVKKFNKDIAYKNQLIRWGEKVGFENLPSHAQKKLNLTFTNQAPKKITTPTKNFVGSKVETFNIPDAKYGSWTYNSQMGLFQAPSEASGQATAVFRSPTPSEKIKIDEAQKKGDWYGHLVTGLPAQYLQTLGGISNKQIGTEDLKESGLLDDKWTVKYKGKTISDYGFLNPVTHYKIFKANYDLKQEVKDITPFMNKYDQAYEDYQKVAVTQEQVDAGGVTEQELLASNKAGGKVNAIVTALEGEESYKSYKKRGKIITVDELVGKSDATNTQQFLYGGATGTTRMIPYLIPASRVVMGADITAKGIDAQSKAETDKEFAWATAQTGLGIFVTYSGVKGMYPDPSTTVATTSKGLATRKVLTHGAIIGLSGGVGVLDAYGNYKRSGNIYQAVGSGVGTGGTLLTGAYFKPMLNKYNDWERNLGKERIYTPKFDEKGFARKSAGGKGKTEEVFMKRYEGFKFKDTKTWKPFLKGQKKGSFLRREYRLIDPKVDARFQGHKEVTYWKWQGNKQVKVTESTETFPKDVVSKHKGWFDQSTAVKQYYLPKKALKNILKDHYKASGFSATDKAWKGTEFADDVISDPKLYGKSWKLSQSQLKELYNVKGAYQFTSGKGVSPAFLRVGNKEATLVQIGGNPAQSPTAYYNYFKGSQVNPALAEIKGKSMQRILAGAKGNDQYLKYYILSNQAKAGHVQLPVSKGEVEGVLEFTRRIPLQSNSYFMFGGRKVAIESQIFAQGHGTNVDKIVEKIAGIRGGGEAVANIPTHLPTYSTLKTASYLPSVSQVSSKVGASINPSRVSDIKSLLKASSVSFGSSTGGSSGVGGSSGISPTGSSIGGGSSGISKPVSEISLSKISLPSSVYNPSKIDIPSTVSDPKIAGLFWKIKAKRTKQKKDKKFKTTKLYLPDFTSRALGLDPIKIKGSNTKKLMAKINQIQTGLEIRRPIRIEGKKIKVKF